MASGRRGAGAGRTPNGRRRRPPPTIDLTATEIAREPIAEPASEPSPEPPEASPSAAAGEPEAEHRDERGPAREAPTTRDESVFERVLSAGLPIDQPRALVAGGIAGAGVTLTVIAVLWLFGAFASRDDGSAALAGRVAAIETQVRDLAGRPGLTGDPKAIARADAIEAASRRLDDRLARAENTLATPRTAPTDPAVLERLGAAEAIGRSLLASIADLRQRIDGVEAAARDAQSRAAAAEKAAAAPPPGPAPAARSELEALAARVAALEHAEKAVDKRVDPSIIGASTERAVRLAVVASALRTAVEGGVPFTAELAAAKTLADGATLVPLEPLAATGAPTIDALAHELAKLEPDMVRAARADAPAPTGGILDRLQANAERLVRIRPAGEAPGDEPAVLIARAEAKASRGDLAGALAEIDRLPPMVKAPAAAWIKAAQARIAAVDAARHFAANALAALAKPAP